MLIRVPHSDEHSLTMLVIFTPGKEHHVKLDSSHHRTHNFTLPAGVTEDQAEVYSVFLGRDQMPAPGCGLCLLKAAVKSNPEAVPAVEPAPAVDSVPAVEAAPAVETIADVEPAPAQETPDNDVADATATDATDVSTASDPAAEADTANADASSADADASTAPAVEVTAEAFAAPAEEASAPADEAAPIATTYEVPAPSRRKRG